MRSRCKTMRTHSHTVGMRQPQSIAAGMCGQNIAGAAWTGTIMSASPVTMAFVSAIIAIPVTSIIGTPPAAIQRITPATVKSGIPTPGVPTPHRRPIRTETKTDARTAIPWVVPPGGVYPATIVPIRIIKHRVIPHIIKRLIKALHPGCIRIIFKIHIFISRRSEPIVIGCVQIIVVITILLCLTPIGCIVLAVTAPTVPT